MNKMLVLAAVIEAATGVALLIVPSLVGQLLFGAELTGIAMTVARVTGIGLIGLGVACWPGTPLVGMLTYSAAVTLCARVNRRDSHVDARWYQLLVFPPIVRFHLAPIR